MAKKKTPPADETAKTQAAPEAEAPEAEVPQAEAPETGAQEAPDPEAAEKLAALRAERDGETSDEVFAEHESADDGSLGEDAAAPEEGESGVLWKEGEEI